MSDPIDDVLGEADGERARSVVDGRWVQASVSQLKTAALCPLKWYYAKVLRYPEKYKGKGAAIGTKGHGELEFYLKTGEPTMGALARAGLPYLPAPLIVNGAKNPGLLIEHRFDGKKKGEKFDPKTALLKAGGVPLDGYIDVVNGRLLHAGGQLWEGGPRVQARTLVVADHKFSKNIEPVDAGGYAALPEHLVDVRFEHGIQMIGYDEWARLMLVAGKLPAFDQIVNLHLYYNNGLGSEKVPRCRPVWTTVDLAHVEQEWFKVNHLARTVVDVAKETDPLKVPFNESACTQYGGCDFANLCPRSPLNRYLTDPGKEEDTMSILDTMFGSAPQVPASAPPPPPPAPLPQPTVAAPAGTPSGWVPAGDAQQGAVYFIPSAGRPAVFTCLTNGLASFSFGPGTTPVLITPTELIFPVPSAPEPARAAPGTAVVGTSADGRPLPAVLPPDAPASNPLTSSEPTKAPPVPAPIVSPEQAAADKAAAKAQKAAEKAAKKAAEAAQFVPQAPSVTIPIPADQQKAVGELLKAETPPTNITVSPATDVNDLPSVRTVAPGFVGIKLFLGCRPDAGSIRLDDYIRDLVSKLCAKYGVKDPRISPRNGTGAKDKDHPLAFDGWKGILSSVVALAPPAPGAYHFSGQSDFADVIVPALIVLLPPENVVRPG